MSDIQKMEDKFDGKKQSVLDAIDLIMKMNKKPEEQPASAARKVDHHSGADHVVPQVAVSSSSEAAGSVHGVAPAAPSAQERTVDHSQLPSSDSRQQLQQLAVGGAGAGAGHQQVVQQHPLSDSVAAPVAQGEVAEIGAPREGKESFLPPSYTGTLIWPKYL